jgi:iodotyrosine deiodinase
MDSKFQALHFQRLEPLIMQSRAKAFLEQMQKRRSVRFYSSEPVPKELIELAILTASSAPSGAHKQPWTFVAVSNQALKERIRAAVEAEELETYSKRMPQEWRTALEPIGTDHIKEHITDAPWIVILFKQKTGLHGEKHYYVTESASIAAGFFIAALHNMGLATLTHTPNPMKILGQILERPSSEEAMLLFPIGYPSSECLVPALTRKSLAQVTVFLE